MIYRRFWLAPIWKRIHLYFALTISIGFLFVGCSKTSGPTQAKQNDEFAKNIRTTEARNPKEEKAGFTLPEGFEIQLFASEPNIGKPLNMAFDARGRMWLTQSFEYPFPDTTGNPRDQISILEDTDGDGQADKFTVFADSLNIPIGIVAVQDGAIAYSIPNIYHLIDSDGDDRVDKRKILYRGFQHKDTHGMINNMVRSWDGWIHADHGFSNTSTVAGSDGDTIVMYSGNTFRIRPDGSRIEFTTTGRVNPYGYAYDEMGYTYSTDCHTSPIYQLVRGADYPHFGKKPTGIGFGPALMEHDHGSTALAGLDYYIAGQFPEEYQNSFYLGDVVMCRVFRSRMEMKGTTPVVSWDPDFIVSEDPWFRPVDVKLGPDGALYIADFYNRIIGHYEVPLDHPGRDRQRGRIWRVTYTGNPTQKAKNWAESNLTELVQNLHHSNLPLRMSIADQIVDRFGTGATKAITGMMEESSVDYRAYVQGLWILYRLESLSTDIMTQALQSDNTTIRIQALRVLFEMEKPDPTLLNMSALLLKHESPHVQRQAIMVAAKHPTIDQVRPLLSLGQMIPTEDTHLSYTLKQGLRDHIRKSNIMKWISTAHWSESETRLLATGMLGDSTKVASQFLARHLAKHQESADLTRQYSKHIGRYGGQKEIDHLANTLSSKTAEDQEMGISFFKAFKSGMELSGRPIAGNALKWGTQLADFCFDEDIIEGSGWSVIPFEHHPYWFNAWQVTDTIFNGSKEEITFLSSEPLDGSWSASGIIQSPHFTLPETISFKMIGSKKEPNENQSATAPANKIELRLVDNDKLLKQTSITARAEERDVKWKISKDLRGQQAYLSVIDGGQSGSEFIAIGQISPSVVKIPEESPYQVADNLTFASNLVRDLQLSGFGAKLEQLFHNQRADIFARVGAAKALLQEDYTQTLSMLGPAIEEAQETPLFKEELASVLAEKPTTKAVNILLSVFDDLSYQRQKQIALKLASQRDGINQLFDAVSSGTIAPHFLSERQMKEALSVSMDEIQKEKLAAITANIKIADEDIQELIDARLKGYRMKRHSVEDGRLPFTQLCTTCHQLKGQGNIIGPQLDGIGNWGLRALTEKILDPNRNISKAFVNYTIVLNDGKTRSGLFRRADGDHLVFADVGGKEFTIPKKDIKEQRISPSTLMPDHFGKIISQDEFYALMAFLLNEK